MSGWYETRDYHSHYYAEQRDATWAWWTAPLSGGFRNATGGLIALDFDQSLVLRQLRDAAGDGEPLITRMQWFTTLPPEDMDEFPYARLSVHVESPFTAEARVLIALRERNLAGLEELASDARSFVMLGPAHEGHLVAPFEPLLLPADPSPNLAETIACVRGEPPRNPDAN